MDVNAFPLVGLRDCHALIEEGVRDNKPDPFLQTTSQDQTKLARHNNLTHEIALARAPARFGTFVMVPSWFP